MDEPKLFLSYNGIDRSSVVAVQKLLEARGITTFLDRDQLVPGLPWPQALEEGLRGVCAVAVFIGRELGGWQKREMWFALDRQVREEKQSRPFPVIPVLLAGADLTPCFLFSNTWIDLRSLGGGVDADTLYAFEHAITAGAPAPVDAERAALLCPYRGLEAFREEHVAFFAGRTKFATSLLKFTLGRDLVAVVGPSGSGKSSVVQAGLVPLLRRQLPPDRTWDVASFTPGSDPFHRLASAVIPFLEPDQSEVDRLAEAQKLGDKLAAGDVKLGSVIDRVIKKSNGTGRLLLVADQFEELFTLTPEPDRRPFAAALLGALGKAHFTLLLTLRADFYSQIINLDRELSDRLAATQVNIGALTRDELRESITLPAKLVGLKFEVGLVDRILDDVGREPGNLPLLEFALTGLWSKRQGSTLTNAAYNEIGGVTGALAQRAENEFARFSSGEQTAARRLFSRLVRVARPEEGAEDTRQRLELSARDAVTEKVAQALAAPDVRLLVMGRPEKDAQNTSPTVEVAHEALIRNWERLRGWLNEDREFLLWRQRTQIQVEQWEQHEQDASYLLRGVPLSEAERWLVGRPQDLMATEQQFVSDSVALREREQAAEERRRQAEVENAQRLKAAAEAKAETERQRAVEQASHAAEQFALREKAEKVGREAVTRELVAFSTLSLEDDPERSILLSMHAIHTTQVADGTVIPEAEDALHRAILRSSLRFTLRGHSAPVVGVAVSGDGRFAVSASQDKTLKVWDLESGRELRTLEGHMGEVNGVALDGNGRRAISAYKDKTLKVWDLEKGRRLRTLRGHSGAVFGVALSADGQLAVSASQDKTVKVWDLKDGHQIRTLKGHSGAVYGVALSSDGRQVVSASQDKTLKVWDLESGRALRTMKGHSRHVWGVALSEDGRVAVSASQDKTLKVWDLGSGLELRSLEGHSAAVRGVAMTADGRRVISASWDKILKVWDVQSGRELRSLEGHAGRVYGVAVDSDGGRAVSASNDNTLKLWDLQSGRELRALEGFSGGIRGVALSGDGGLAVSASKDKTLKAWDLEKGRKLHTMKGHSGAVNRVALSADGRLAVSASDDKTLKIWDVESGCELRTLEGHTEAVLDVAISGDGVRAISASEDKTLKVWDVERGCELQTMHGHTDWVTSVAVSVDGRWAVSACADYTLKAWDVVDGRELRKLEGHFGAVLGLAVSADGRRAVSASEDKTLKIWDVESGCELRTLESHSEAVDSVAISPDGKRLASAGKDKKVRVWDTDSGRELITLAAHRDFVGRVAWSADGKILLSAGDDGIIHVYAMDIDLLLSLARSRVTRNLTVEECRKYLHSDDVPPIP